MASDDHRAHGVTPGLRQDYATRTVSLQGAFMLPYLRPGMNLIDVGCGLGTITLGLAQAVHPGHVIGIDHDAAHVKAASALATERGVTNVTFEEDDAMAPKFDDSAFDPRSRPLCSTVPSVETVSPTAGRTSPRLSTSKRVSSPGRSILTPSLRMCTSKSLAGSRVLHEARNLTDSRICAPSQIGSASGSMHTDTCPFDKGRTNPHTCLTPSYSHLLFPP
jgi:hypothetical protein